MIHLFAYLYKLNVDLNEWDDDTCESATYRMTNFNLDTESL